MNSIPLETCEVSVQEYNQIKNSLKNVSVNSTRVTMAKQIIETKKCFTVDQLRGIVKLFSVESSRYEVAEFGYDYCIDPGNYYQITEEFNTTSSKNKMLEFLNSKK